MSFFSRVHAVLALIVLLAIVGLALTPINLEKNGTQFLYFEEWLHEFTSDSPMFVNVVKNVDGDTIAVNYKGNTEFVRFIGVDTPETVHPRKPVEYFGKEASDFTKALLPAGSTIALTMDNEDRDRYDRLLRFIWFSVKYKGEEFWVLHNLVLVLNGYAKAYTYFPFRQDYMNAFVFAENYAIEHCLGMWKEPSRVGMPASFVPSKTKDSVLPIMEAKKLPDYKVVEVEGVVTVPPGPFDVNILFIQDETGGINIYGKGVDLSTLGIEYGDLVHVKGMLYTHRKNREITVNVPTAITILGKGEIPGPLIIKTKQINDSELQGMLVQTTGKLIEMDPPKYYIDDGSGKGLIYIRTNTGIHLTKVKLGSEITVTGVLGQYEWLHELWPRWPEDIVTEDFDPPTIVMCTLQSPKVLDVVLNEAIMPESVIPNKTIRVKNNRILSVEISENKKIIRLVLESETSSGAVFLLGVKDLNGNMQNIFKRIYSINREKRVLFDEGHGQTAGNADWTIEGGYSDFAEELKEEGYLVDRTLVPLDYFTFCQYDVFVIPEPNRPFDDSEIEALVRFVEEGGGVFFIADHGGADRNGNGWDAVRIFNDFVPDIFGIKFDGNDLVIVPVTEIEDTPLTEGVEEVGLWNGSTITITRPEIHVAVEAYGKPYVVYGNYGEGRFVAIGDSSPFDDGTGAPGKNLYNGWFMYDDSNLAINIVKWLSQ